MRLRATVRPQNESHGPSPGERKRRPLLFHGHRPLGATAKPPEVLGHVSGDPAADVDTENQKSNVVDALIAVETAFRKPCAWSAIT